MSRPRGSVLGVGMAGAALLAGLVLPSAATALTEPAASAQNATRTSPVYVSASGYGRCASPDFCLFEHIDGGGRLVGLRAGRAVFPPDFDNLISSLRNRAGRTWSLYTEAGYRGRCLNASAIYTGDVTRYEVNDRLSSARPGPCPA